jgi:hypothetical protein
MAGAELNCEASLTRRLKLFGYLGTSHLIESKTTWENMKTLDTNFELPEDTDIITSRSQVGGGQIKSEEDRKNRKNLYSIDQGGV